MALLKVKAGKVTPDTTAVPLSASQVLVEKVIIKNVNATSIYIGGSGVTSAGANGITLEQNAILELESEELQLNLADIYTAAGSSLSNACEFIYIYRD